MRTAVFGLLIASRVAVAAPKLTPEQCKVEATALGAFLAATPHTKHPLLSQRGFALARRTDLTTPVPVAPVINASRLETSVQGVLAKTRAELTKEVKKRKAKQAVLMIEQQTPWSRVVEIVEVVTAAGVAPIFVFEVELVVPQPPRSPYDDGIAASKVYPPKPGQKSSDTVVAEVLAPCPALGKLFAAARGEGVVDRAKIIVEGAAAALTACACSTDLASARSFLWDLVVERRTARAIVFDQPATEKLALPATTMWGEASKQLVPGKSYTFAVAP